MNYTANIQRVLALATPDEIRDGLAFYWEFNGVAKVLKSAYGLRSVAHGAGVLAALSPMNNWHDNVTDAFHICAWAGQVRRHPELPPEFAPVPKVQLCIGHPYANKHGWQRLHRYLMMRRLGRRLKPYEHCHHKPDAPKDTLDPWQLELLEDVEHGRWHAANRRSRVPGDMRESWCERDERGRFTKIPAQATNGTGSEAMF